MLCLCFLFLAAPAFMGSTATTFDQTTPDKFPFGPTAAEPTKTESVFNQQEKGTAPIPFSEIGAKATADYKGDAIGLRATAAGARLHTAFQKLSGTVTRDGLRIDSTAEQGGDLRLRASAIGRDRHSEALPATGTVAVDEKVVTFTRPGLTEEYSVSVDGVRQDFMIATRPAGPGDLRVDLALDGAKAEAAADGARLILDGSGRKLAYHRVRVTDASGRELSATLQVLSSHRLAVRVADAGAIYPVRIDPTFSDADWTSLGGANGANDIIRAVAVDGSGTDNIYIGGEFATAGGVAANYIAKWNGSAWSALGSGMNDSVNALAVDGNGDLYAGGFFTTAGGVANTSRIAKWNGSVHHRGRSGKHQLHREMGWQRVVGPRLGHEQQRPGAGGGRHWQSLRRGRLHHGRRSGGQPHREMERQRPGRPSSSGMNNTVLALAVDGTGDLYAGGFFTAAGAVAAIRIAKWNGNAWSALGSGMNDTVNALAVDGNGDLYAGGFFTTAGGVPANHIAKWNGSAWSALGSGLNSIVRALAVDGTDNLYAGDSSPRRAQWRPTTSRNGTAAPGRPSARAWTTPSRRWRWTALAISTRRRVHHGGRRTGQPHRAMERQRLVGPRLGHERWGLRASGGRH